MGGNIAIVAEHSAAEHFAQGLGGHFCDDIFSAADISPTAVALTRKIVFALICPRLADGHFVFGDSSRLVGADDRCAAQSFHGVELVNKGIFAEHSADSQRKRNGDCGGKPLGDSRYGDRYACHEHIENRLAL